MTLKQSIKICLIEKYATFNGRASRSEYWWFILFQVLLLIVVGITLDELQLYLSRYTVILLLVIILLVFLPPHISVGIRRLHDSNSSGLWYFVQFFPYIGWFVFLLLTVLPPEEPNRFDEKV